MALTSALVLFAVIWFLCLMIGLQLRITTQAETGEVAPGTPPSAPVNPAMGKRFFWVTVASLAIWAPLCGLILSGWIGIDDIDLFRAWREAS
ncbi:MAG: DUF1467 family protein [Rhodobacteraceae bacterium]|jgi:predicted secreted protein|nr:DUF1467 family protein [Paracoccaceae bacterium]MBL4557405.1 DUF1467 family protein [Paracoccaceae bacterium]HBG97656.1 DUF1467 domain-containing protein [Paracoccaceae bacterium]